MLAIYKREVRSYFQSMVGCVFVAFLIAFTGISTCCPSATTLVLTLGPDLPRADQLYPGNLGYSA